MIPIQWKMHRPWILSCSLILMVLLSIPLGARSYNRHLEERKQTLSQKREELSRQLDQWREDSRKAMELSQTLPHEEVKALLAPLSRQKWVEQIEPLAASARLINVHYELSPPSAWTGEGTLSNVTGISQSTLKIEADAPHDGDIFTFLEQVGKMPGRLTLKRLIISPLPQEKSQDPSAFNLHLQVDYLWLSNEETL